MTNHRRIVNSKTILSSAALALLLILSGCGGGDDPAPAPTAIAPPPAPKREPIVQRATTIVDLMEEMRIDKRIKMPEELAPSSEKARRSVLSFFDAFARGDADTLNRMMSESDQIELETMQNEGLWPLAVDGIDRVDVRTGNSPEGQPCALAIFETGLELQPQLWQYEFDGEDVTFLSVAMPADVMDGLSGNDWIADWYRLIALEEALAQQPDEDLQLAIILDDLEDIVEDPQGGGRRENPGSPGRPTGPGNRNIPPPPIAPPPA